MSKNNQSTKKIVAQLLKEVEIEVIETATDIINTLRGNPPEGTPIDTGWASSNWIPSVGVPHLTTVGSKTVRVRRKYPIGFSSIKALLKGRYEIASGVIRAKQEAGIAALFKWKIGKGNIYITNNVPYIVRLNEFPQHSKQSPPHFVERAVNKALTKLRSFKVVP